MEATFDSTFDFNWKKVMLFIGAIVIILFLTAVFFAFLNARPSTDWRLAREESYSLDSENVLYIPDPISGGFPKMDKKFLVEANKPVTVMAGLEHGTARRIIPTVDPKEFELIQVTFLGYNYLFDYYPDCYQEDTTQFLVECSGIHPDSGLLIIAPDSGPVDVNVKIWYFLSDLYEIH